MKKVLLVLAIFSYCTSILHSFVDTNAVKTLVFEFKVQPTETDNTTWSTMVQELAAFSDMYNQNDPTRTACDEFDATVSFMKQLFTLATANNSTFSGEIQCNVKESSIEELSGGIVIKFFTYVYDLNHMSSEQAVQQSYDFYRAMQECNTHETILATILPYLQNLKELIYNNPTSLNGSICIWYKPTES